MSSSSPSEGSVNNTEPVTLSQYYLSFKGVYVAIVGAFSAIPFLSKLLPQAFGPFVFPPLGTADDPLRIATFVLAMGMTLLAFFTGATPPKRNNKRVVAAVILAFFSACLYLVLSLLFVRTIEVPSMNTSVQVSVGYERTEFANQYFSGESDWALLHDRGPDEEDIWKLWSRKSLIITRLSLYAAYCLFLFPIVLAFSWGVLDQQHKH